MTMRTAVTETSIDAFHAAHRRGQVASQSERIMGVIRPWCDYSLQEIAKKTGVPVHLVSARVNALKAAGRLEIGPVRKCSITGVTIKPVRLPREQLEMFS